MSHMRVSKSVEKAFQLAFLKLKRRRKGVGVGVTAALIRLAIGRCWVKSTIMSSTNLSESHCRHNTAHHRAPVHSKPRSHVTVRNMPTIDVCRCWLVVAHR